MIKNSILSDMFWKSPLTVVQGPREMDKEKAGSVISPFGNSASAQSVKDCRGLETYKHWQIHPYTVLVKLNRARDVHSLLLERFHSPIL